MTEDTGFAEPAEPAADTEADGQPGTGPVSEDQPAAEPLTGVPDAETATPMPPVDADPQEVAEEAAAAEPAAAAEVAEPAEPAPEPEQPEAISPTAAAAASPADSLPFIPSEGVPGWLRDFLTELHRRLFNLEG